jgi:large subunit ribosomal protein L9e
LLDGHIGIGIDAGILTEWQSTGKLVKNLGHLAVNFGQPKKNTISIEIHHGNRKNVATLRTVRSIISNLIVGVTKGFKYKMRYVYAHFPINVNVEKNGETGLFEVEIRNFIGEKIVRHVVMQPGVDVEISKAQKDELVLTGNSLENVSQSAADIQQICRVRNKDIRKVRTQNTFLKKREERRIACGSADNGENEGTSWLTNISYSSWTVSTSPRRATSLRNRRRQRVFCFFCVLGSQEWRRVINACQVARSLLYEFKS